jgi:hypothetical protein
MNAEPDTIFLADGSAAGKNKTSIFSWIKQQLCSNWHTMRIVRGVLSLLIIIQAITLRDMPLGLFGGFFLLMTAFNTGCCAGGSCNTENSNPAAKGNDNIEFEELK